jgi:hypothetical protein
VLSFTNTIVRKGSGKRRRKKEVEKFTNVWISCLSFLIRLIRNDKLFHDRLVITLCGFVDTFRVGGMKVDVC